MFTLRHESTWSPLYFLAALGAGGMVVTFFMYLLFWIPHPAQPIPVYEDWIQAFADGSPLSQLMIIVAISGIVLFAIFHAILLSWNLARYMQWRKETDIASVKGSNAHTQMLAVPLTLAMTINALFIVGAIFVPGLWEVIEYLFPIAMAAFIILGAWAMRLYLSFFSHTVSYKRFDSSANNSLAQLLPGFAFAMISVGLAAPSAMSHNTVTVGVSVFFAGVFMVPALFVSIVKLVIGFTHMLEHGANKAALPTLWVGVPILTILSILMLRINHGLAHTLDVNDASGTPFLFLVLVVATQIFLLLLGAAVMDRMGYFRSLWQGQEKSPVIYALICPGVAFSVSLHFFINKGLLAVGLLEKFGLAYWSLSAVAIAFQLLTAIVLIKLVRQQIMLSRQQPELQAA